MYTEDRDEGSVFSWVAEKYSIDLLANQNFVNELGHFIYPIPNTDKLKDHEDNILEIVDRMSHSGSRLVCMGAKPELLMETASFSLTQQCGRLNENIIVTIIKRLRLNLIKNE